MSKRATLEEWIYKRSGGALSAEEAAGNVRAELDRLARKVRNELKGIHANTVAYKKSKEPMDYILYERGLAAEGTLKDVLALIKDAKR
jgi:hypothetical protein